MAILDDDTGVARARMAPVLFTLTIFLSASLLFFVQPLFTRIVLPQIGGSPSVWTTAMLFFQSALIGGYLYAHVLTRLASVPVQIAVHAALWALALAFLPLAVPEGWRYDPAGSAAGQTLLLYLAGVGLPFFVLSANAPLIQSWYSRSGGPSAHDPYFLYGASNLGSLIALLGFPLAAEPLFGISAIGRGFAAGFVALGAALVLCGLAARGAPRPAWRAAAPARTRTPVARMALWAGLAFLPSSLMLGVTLKISTDLGSIPLVWAVPLSLYLLTFVLAFGDRRWLTGDGLRRLARPAVAVLVVLASGLAASGISWWTVGVLLAAFFAVALMAHRRLYELRPGGEELTLFYLVMSVGGALGGVFNSLLAPVLFDDLNEFTIAAVAAVALLLARPLPRLRVADLALGALGAGAVLALRLGLSATGAELNANLRVMVLAAALFAVLWTLRGRGVAALLAAALLAAGQALLLQPPSLMTDRSFFGTHVVRDTGAFRTYVNGSTEHGLQAIAELGAARPTPASYYYPAGPMGQVLSSTLGQSAARVGIVGLGAGALACYRHAGQDWHFYEIDRKVDEIARDSRLFTYMSACAPQAPTHLGDARIVLQAQPDLRFDVLVIDAYSSNAVPLHLTTTEAIDLYRSRLAPGGVLVLHISNRYYALDRPLGRSAAALGLEARIQSYRPTPETEARGDHPSLVVLMAAEAGTLAPFDADGRWQVLAGDGGTLWTDEYANLLSALR